MSNDNQITVIGNLTRDPELRYTTAGVAVVSFSIAQSERRKKDDKWEDGPISFFNCSAWRELGENIAASFAKGQRVMVTGRMQMRDWEDKEGNKRSSWELEVHDAGTSVRWGTTIYEKAERSQSNSSGGGGGRSQSQQGYTDPIYGDEEPF